MASNTAAWAACGVGLEIQTRMKLRATTAYRIFGVDDCSRQSDMSHSCSRRVGSAKLGSRRGGDGGFRAIEDREDDGCSGRAFHCNFRMDSGTSHELLPLLPHHHKMARKSVERAAAADRTCCFRAATSLSMACFLASPSA